MEDQTAYRSDYFQLELLPYALSATYFAFRNFIYTQEVIVGARANRGIANDEILVLKPEERDPMNFAVDAFLEAARRAQNALIPYISRALSQPNLPSSMNDLVKNLDRGTIVLPEPIAKCVSDYWRDHGRKLKEYRDLSQHFALVTSEARVFLNAQQDPHIYLSLPLNPEVRSPVKLVWKPPLHAFLYMRKQLYELIRVSHRLTKMLVRSGTKATYQQVFRDWISTATKGEGCRLPKEGEMDREIEKLIQRLNASTDGPKGTEAKESGDFTPNPPPSLSE